MSDLIVLTFNSEEKAGSVLKEVAMMKQQNVQKALIGIEDAAVVYKNAKGNVKVRQTLESTIKGGRVASGGFWGLLIGFLFGGPLLGSLLGMGLSALFGRNIDIGIDNEFIKQVGDELSPGDSALFLLVTNTPVETVGDALKEFSGSLYHTSFSKETAELFVQAMEDETLKTAVTAQQAA